MPTATCHTHGHYCPLQVASPQYIICGTQDFLCTNGNYVLNETMPHTLAIHYPVHLPCNLQLLSRVHKKLCYNGFSKPDKQKKREIVSISFSEHGNCQTKRFMYSHSRPKLCFIGSECHWGQVKGVVLTEFIY